MEPTSPNWDGDPLAQTQIVVAPNAHEVFASADPTEPRYRVGPPDVDAETAAAAAAMSSTTGLRWLGPLTFQRQAGVDPGNDQDFGLRWGLRRDRRVALRTSPGSPTGLLYAYDATWDEYAVLAVGVEPHAVTAAYRLLPDYDQGADVEDLVRALQAPAVDPQEPQPRLAVEL